MQTPIPTHPTSGRTAHSSHPPGPVERVVSVVVMGVLVVIAASVWRAQGRANPALNLPLPAPTQPPPVGDNWLDEVPAAFAPLGPSEQFDAEFLSDKINGKAELYLTAGFAALTTRRFAGSDRADDWFEVYVYEMASPRAAYAVYSAQRRPDAQALIAAAEGYVAGNGVFGLRGRHYLEVIAAELTGTPAAKAFALALLERLPADGAVLNERDLFPPNRVVPDRFSLIAENGFGFDQFDQVMTAQLRMDAGDVTAFVSRRSDPDTARVLADAYREFLLANGGQSRPAPPEFSDAAAIDLFGALEIVFTVGDVVAGIHEADDAAAGWKAAHELNLRMREGAQP